MREYTLSAKNCMSNLLQKETFDRYLFIEGECTTSVTTHMDGYLHRDFFETPPEDVYARWQDVRNFFLELVRGKTTPLDLKIVLCLPPSAIAGFLKQKGISSFRPEEITGMYLNFHFNGEGLTCTTGISTSAFSLDKTLEREWDDYAATILKEMILDQ